MFLWTYGGHVVARQWFLPADRLRRAGMQVDEIRFHRRFHHIRRYVNFWVIRDMLRMSHTHTVCNG